MHPLGDSTVPTPNTLPNFGHKFGFFHELNKTFCSPSCFGIISGHLSKKIAIAFSLSISVVNLIPVTTVSVSHAVALCTHSPTMQVLFWEEHRRCDRFRESFFLGAPQRTWNRSGQYHRLNPSMHLEGRSQYCDAIRELIHTNGCNKRLHIQLEPRKDRTTRDNRLFFGEVVVSQHSENLHWSLGLTSTTTVAMI